MKKNKIVIVSGLSGAGKTTALNTMEDMGYYVVDNLPCEVGNFFINTSIEKLGLGIDIRSFKKVDELFLLLAEMKKADIDYSLIFIEASEEIILNRYNLTRRKHPLEAATLLESIQKEREIMFPIRESATGIIDTSYIKPKELSERVKEILMVDGETKDINIHVQSFGFKYGIPIDLDLLFDVRFLPNPYYIEELKEKTGEDEAVSSYVMGYSVAQEFAQRLLNLMDFLIPNYIKEGKKHLTIGIGCSGGKHRSVTLASLLYKELSKQEKLNVYISHREKERGNW
ncbi:RNase adapter RapZ [Fusobacterium sp.]|uniref:RNase adapter RapZ n=1 Tax=Fusobacterium sp. TaxID=68766 RepID=UPI0028FFE328|nr:RNase adapter RapZ [Fusobacterium sp.]MDU1911866.1 RNase adapter RapZ [Fusobacterium sp.]